MLGAFRPGLGLGPTLGTIMTEVSTSTFKTRPYYNKF